MHVNIQVKYLLNIYSVECICVRQTVKLTFNELIEKLKKLRLFHQIVGGYLKKKIEKNSDVTVKNKHRQQREKVEEKWANLKQTSRAECVRTFLNVVRKWPLCDATFYAAKVSCFKFTVVQHFFMIHC